MLVSTAESTSPDSSALQMTCKQIIIIWTEFDEENICASITKIIHCSALVPQENLHERKTHFSKKKLETM